MEFEHDTKANGAQNEGGSVHDEMKQLVIGVGASRQEQSGLFFGFFFYCFVVLFQNGSQDTNGMWRSNKKSPVQTVPIGKS